MADTKLDLDSIETKTTGRGSLARIVRKLVARIRDLENASAAPAVAAMPDGWAFSKDGYGNWKIDAPTGDQILVRASSTSVRADVLRNLCADLLKVPTNRTT